MRIIEARALVAGALFACAGCGMSAPGTPLGPSMVFQGDASTTRDGPAPRDDAAGDAAALPEEAAPADDDAGTYHHGVYTCCGQGRGLSCCTADAGLLGYDVAPDGAITPVGGRAGSTQANCYQYGGTAGSCYSDGAMFDAKDSCAICCAGLTHVQIVVPTDGGSGPTCTVAGVPSLFMCIPCGNGTCDPNENHCTCPADCP